MKKKRENILASLQSIKDTILTKIEEVEDVKLEDENVKLEQMTLENGTVLEAESFDVGEAVFVVSEDERVPLPDGEYELDGRIMVVVEGLIAEFREAEAAEEPQAEEEMSEEPKYATIEDLTNAVNEIKSLLSKEVKASKEEVTKLSKENEKLKVELKETPDAKPIKHAPKEVIFKEAKTPKGRITQGLEQILN